MSQHRQIIIELGYKPRPAREGYHFSGMRSDGAPYAKARKVSAEKRVKCSVRHRIEDAALAKELGISLNELRGEVEK